MLLLDITTYEPGTGRELMKLWEQVESMDFPKGLKIINQWFDAGGGRAFTLYEAETIEDYMAYNFPFTDMCKVEVFPVIEAKDFQKFASEYIEKLSNMGVLPKDV
jgi:hypothetical protein